ncbi:sulfotransferase domain-containing protein [Litoribrevibacter albus]|uniref:Sulfotransferase n=1 Tax=Litoribrevibacter albus TaxID=1473156 RepID=A0AA37W984_9GAMM|nr:sulfotransferase domain-containing protein [Litoribrevibacter albus]GLQ33208.1 sulfotransferase [Litoribrevibacter albus]
MVNKVVFIASSSRSGSTIFEQLLSQDPRFFGLGEMRYYYTRMIRDNELCSCGKVGGECDFWSGNFKHVSECGSIIDSQNKIDRIRYLYKYIFLKPANVDDPFINNILSTYNYAFEKSKVSNLIDSSKHLSYVFLFSKIHENKVVWFIRKPKDVVISWLVPKRRPEITGKITYMEKQSVIFSTLEWVFTNMLFLIMFLVKGKAKVKPVFYEDFVNNPGGIYSEFLDFMGYKPNVELLSSLDSSKSFEVNENHQVAGNPVRFNTGVIKINIGKSSNAVFKWYHSIFVRLFADPLYYLIRVITK